MCMYKMVDISAETWTNAGVSAIRVHKNDNVNKTLLQLLCISEIAKRWCGKNIYDLIDEEIKGKYQVKNINCLTKPQMRKYKIRRARLIKGSKHSMYVHEDIAITIIMQTRLSDPRTIKFRANLGFNDINLILRKEQLAVIPLLKAFSGVKIKLQHKALENERVRTDMYFSHHKSTVEIDEKDILTEIKTKKAKDKQKWKNILIENFFAGIILMQRVLIFFLKLVKNKIASLNQTKKN